MKLLAYAILFFISNSTPAASPDFFIASRECRITVGSLVAENLKVISGDPPTHGCIRNGKNIFCSVNFISGEKPVNSETIKFDVLLDSPPQLYFATDNGSTFIAVNTQTRLAVFTERFNRLEFSAVKLCSAYFVTSSELEMLGQPK